MAKRYPFSKRENEGEIKIRILKIFLNAPGALSSSFVHTALGEKQARNTRRHLMDLSSSGILKYDLKRREYEIHAKGTLRDLIALIFKKVLKCKGERLSSIFLKDVQEWKNKNISSAIEWNESVFMFRCSVYKGTPHSDVSELANILIRGIAGYEASLQHERLFKTSTTPEENHLLSLSRDALKTEVFHVLDMAYNFIQTHKLSRVDSGLISYLIHTLETQISTGIIGPDSVTNPSGIYDILYSSTPSPSAPPQTSASCAPQAQDRP